MPLGHYNIRPNQLFSTIFTVASSLQKHAVDGPMATRETPASRPQVALTIVPIVLRHAGRSIHSCAFMDSGSDATLTRQSLVKRLGLTGRPKRPRVLNQLSTLISTGLEFDVCRFEDGCTFKRGLDSQKAVGNVHSDIKRLHNMEFVDSTSGKERDMSIEDQDTLIKLKDGQYEIGLPWRTGPLLLPDSRCAVLQHLQTLRTRLQRDRGLLANYCCL
ncbi:hypothetical protein PHET_05627 [Paragonimus heterotremus]|uniref:Uncharacterized protein n=1 Tax=Paragonimus heterotremus TaxID=100268 RepID=A0A8J4TEN0_9TREM|nr:hypothetical protein PHET_05627 [Paragonimus heterotremus]